MSLKALLQNYRELLAYGFFGVCTVIVNTIVYYGLSLWMDDLVANTIAFFIAVQFAYMTNTKFVFLQNFTKKKFSEILEYAYWNFVDR